MKLSLLTTALLATLALSACQKNEPTPEPPATDAAAPAADAMAPANGAMTPPADDAMANDDAMAGSGKQMVGGAEMMASDDIVANASKASNLSTLVSAVKEADLVETLQGAGPFTVFAPTNDAFDKLPAGTVDTLMKPDAKADLKKLLTYHVVPGTMDAEALTKAITDGGGMAKLKTVQGEELIAKADGGKVTVTDAKGNVATVTTADVRQSNGVVHVIDTVLMP